MPLQQITTEVKAIRIGKHGNAKYHFIAKDIFNGKIYEENVLASHILRFLMSTKLAINKLTYPRMDSRVSKYDINLLSPIKGGFAEGKDVRLTVLSAMGEEQIIDIKVFTSIN
ncbi:eukaryotic translation initiation factor 5A-1-like [Apium graveolens]|uniref:eukaryotic translation initiation factor 5A-1-like n=1 Tax=Apium graveolens TaxID=4045 RepID=UPI003D7B6A9A